MAQRLVVDPITRIEGHLRIEAEVDQSNTITKAYSSGTMVRGIEIILKRSRPTRSLGLYPARLRGVHHRAFLCIHPLGGRCFGYPNPQSR